MISNIQIKNSQLFELGGEWVEGAGLSHLAVQQVDQFPLQAGQHALHLPQSDSKNVEKNNPRSAIVFPLKRDAQLQAW